MALLALTLTVLSVLDASASVDADSSAETYLRVTVVDLDGEPLHNAQVEVCGKSFCSDNKGLSPNILLTDLSNAYDASVSQWHTVNVVVKKDGYVPALAINCVVYDGQSRKLTVRLYQNDASNLPYVCYVESPPQSYLQQLVGQ